MYTRCIWLLVLVQGFRASFRSLLHLVFVWVFYGITFACILGILYYRIALVGPVFNESHIITSQVQCFKAHLASSLQFMSVESHLGFESVLTFVDTDLNFLTIYILYTT